jgi:hypothetical protein
VISPVSFDGRACTRHDKSGFASPKRPQAERRPELALDDIDDAPRALSRQKRNTEPAYRHHLIWPKEAISLSGDMVDIDYVIEATALRVPEAVSKAL